VAVQVTVFVPIAKRLPEFREQVTCGDGSQLSVAVVMKLLLAPAAEAASSMMLLEHVITGAVVSATVMVWLSGALTLPLQSMAVQVRVTL
jgi:hypothetical protein